MIEQKLALDNQIFRCKAGSHAYGTNTAASDIDERGVFIAPPKYTIGCLFGCEQVQIPGEDTEIYELGKFVRLCVDCNPNIIELLFTDQENMICSYPEWETLRMHRDLFLSKKAKFTFSGYAMAQMKRIKGHNKWITNPQPEREPQLMDFAKYINSFGNVTPMSELFEPFREDVLSKCFLAKVNATTYRIFSSPDFHKPAISEDGRNIQFVDISEENIKERALSCRGILVVQEEAYKKERKNWKDYWSWKKNRNKARSLLEEKFGYDTKHAMHLMRLLRMAKEILTEGKVIVRRPDAQELLDIRAGKFNYDEMLAEAEARDAELEVLYKTSSLPHSADKEKINDLYIDIVQKYWKRTGWT